MVKLINNLKENLGVQLCDLNDSDFFEYDGYIYQRLAWNDDDLLFNCAVLPSMEYVGIKCDTIVKPVDVTITINGYTEEK